MEREKLEGWLRRMLYTDRPEGPVVRFVLRHYGSEKKAGGQIHSIKVEDKPTADFVEICAGEIESIAQTDADGVESPVQGYVVQAFAKHGGERYVGRFPFKVSAAADDDELASEPANIKGAFAQQLRHNEALTRIMSGAFGQITSSQGRMIERLETTVVKLMENQMEGLAAMQELIDRRHERELDLKDQENKHKVQADLLDKANVLLPVVLRKLTGQKALPAKAHDPTDPLPALLASITPDQFDKLREVLSVEQQIAMMELFQAMQQGDANGKAPEGETRGH